MNRNDNPATQSKFLILASVCVVVAALYFAQDVLIPIALAVLLSFLLAPIASWLEHWRLPRVAATLIVVIIALGIIGGIGYAVYHQAVSLAEQLPTYQENIVHKFQHFRPSKNDVLAKAQQTIEKVGKELETPATQPGPNEPGTATQPTTSPVTSINPNVPGSPTIQPEAPQGTQQNPWWVFVRPQQSRFEQFQTLLSPLISPLGTAFVVIVFTIFILETREDLRDRIIRLFGRGQLTLTTQALNDAATRISRYLIKQATINSCYGVAVGLGLWIIGVPNPAIFGLLSGLLRFIPYIGPWIGASFPVVTALAVFPGYHQVLETIGLYIVIEIITNSGVEPWLYGSSTGMSSMAVLVAAVFWAWLWGPVGLLVSTPLTVVIVVLGKYVPQLQFIDILLGDEPVLSPPMRVYQRLLAMDHEEAMDVLHEIRKTKSLEALYDDVLLPVMSMAEVDRHNGQLDDRRQTFIRQSVRSIVEELGDEQRALLADEHAAEVVNAAKHDAQKPNPSGLGPSGLGPRPQLSHLPKDCTINVVLLPAHHETDELVNLMLAQLLEFSGYCSFTASHTALASEMLDLVTKHKANLVVVSALPPAAVSYARYLCKRVHAAHPDVLMAVGLWTFTGDVKKAKDRITCVANVPLVMNLSGMLKEIHQMVQPLVVHQTETSAK